MVKITIEDPSLEKPIVMEYESVSINLERGLKKIHKPGFISPCDLVPNGQSRATVKLWSGCGTFETFQATTEEFFHV